MNQSFKEIYRTTFKSMGTLPLFFQPWWLDAVCENDWDVALSFDKGGSITGIMPFLTKKMKGFKVISNPVLTPYLGVKLFYPENQSSRISKYSFENKVTQSLIEQLPPDYWYLNLSFHHDFNNWYPFYWKRFEQTIKYTYIIDDIQDIQEVRNQFSNTLRRQINKATKNYSVKVSTDLTTLHRLLHQSLEKQGVKLKIAKRTLQRIYAAVIKEDRGMILEASSQGGEIVSSMLLVYDNRQAYCLILGMDEKVKNNDSVKLLLFEAIKKASEKVESFNFEGSMVPGVERLYRSYGGRRQAYYNISRFRNPWFKALFTLIKT